MNNDTKPTWIESILHKATPIVPTPEERSLIDILIGYSYQHHQVTSVELGLLFAAIYDLLVSLQYYSAVRGSGWVYCPEDTPLGLYPFTNACPRCLLQSRFVFHRSNKPASGNIGSITSRLLCLLLQSLFLHNKRHITVFRGVEPVDVLFYEEATQTVLLAEIKAAPLTTLPLAIPLDLGSTHQHSLPSYVQDQELSLLLPCTSQSAFPYRLVHLGRAQTVRDSRWAYSALKQVLEQDSRFFVDYAQFWFRAYEAYKKEKRHIPEDRDPAYWWTNGCGQPIPRPPDWPKTRTRQTDGSAHQEGTGYESLSDSKSSVGMDRTDDVKKGIYQVLKMGIEGKHPNSGFNVKTALLSNLHAVRHYTEYLEPLQDIVWTRDPRSKIESPSNIDTGNTVYNLFDGIISFSQTYARDTWIHENFSF